MWNNTKEQGISLYLAFMLMTVLLAMALGLSTILLSQLKTMRSLGKSTIALCAADTGIERAMYVIEKEGVLADLSGQVGEADYQVEPEYEGEETYIKAVGIYKGVRRAVRVILAGKAFPRIRNTFITPPSSPKGTIFTIQTDILDSEGVVAETVFAYVQRPDEVNIVELSMLLISGNAFIGTYRTDWDSSGAEQGAYLVDITACNIIGNCREKENLETTVP